MKGLWLPILVSLLIWTAIICSFVKITTKDVEIHNEVSLWQVCDFLEIDRPDFAPQEKLIWRKNGNND